MMSQNMKMMTLISDINNFPNSWSHNPKCLLLLRYSRGYTRGYEIIFIDLEVNVRMFFLHRYENMIRANVSHMFHLKRKRLHMNSVKPWLSKWSIPESNRWPLDCQSNALANWANAPMRMQIYKIFNCVKVAFPDIE